MAYNNRTLSPGGKRIQNAGRTSDSRVNDVLADQYRSDRHNSYVPPRNSVGVIPISTETFVNYPASHSTQQRYDSYSGRPLDSYSGRPRQTSNADSQRTSTASVNQPSSRGRPTVVQSEYTRPTSPSKGSQGRDYHVTAATTKEPRKETTRKVYSVNDGTASLVADVNLTSGAERHHRRRDSELLERSGLKAPAPERERGRKGYHLNGPVRIKEKSIDDDDAFSYTDAAGMFKETEPKWREREVRPRRNSVDRASGSRERPLSMLDPAIDPRRPNREMGPPPSARGWDKIKDVMSRASSVREKVPRSPTRAKEQYPPVEAKIPQSPTRGRYAEPKIYAESRDRYYVPPRMPSLDKYAPVSAGAQSDRYEHFEIREPRPHERRNSMTRIPDRSVERRGFGIRNDSQDRYGRGSDESVTRDTQYRDSGFAGMHSSAEPHRRDTAPDLGYSDELRPEPDKRDRQGDRQRFEEREVPRERESREQRNYSRDEEYDRERRRERDADYETDRQRERERERILQPQSDRDRHHRRRDSYRDHGYDRREAGPRESGDSISQPSLAAAATTGLAGAATAYGISSHATKHDERDRDRKREYDAPVERVSPEERDRTSPRLQDTRPFKETRSQDSRSDEGAHYRRDRGEYRSEDNDRGLGFAFEQPSVPPATTSAPSRDRAGTATSEQVADREFERTHDDRPPVDAAPVVDPDEDYRRRLEQVQRELGQGSGDRADESDPDRERRRREREQRLRERELRNGDGSIAGTASTYAESMVSHPMPGSFDNGSMDGSGTTASRPGLRRRRSILDEPMVNEPAQIIDNSMSEKRENRVRIVDPPTEEELPKPRGILKKPTEKFPEHPNEVREGVAPLKDASKSGIPPGARWTKIDRRLVNPEALEDAKERFEERLDFVIVLRVLTKAEIQKLADRTKEIRDERHEDERQERRAARHRERRQRDEYEDEDSEDEFKPRAPKMLEAPSTVSTADQDSHYTSGSGVQGR